MTPHDAAHGDRHRDESDRPGSTPDTVVGRLRPETAVEIDTVLLPDRAEGEDKFHRPLASGALLPACGTFENAGVERQTDDVRARGYRPCLLCWPASGRGAPKPLPNTGGDSP